MAQTMADALSAISMATVRRTAARSNELKEAVVVAKAKANTQREIVIDAVKLVISLATAL